MKAFIYRNGHEFDAPFCGVDPAGNLCAIANTMTGAIEEAGLFSVYHHAEKVSIELVSAGANKKFDAAQKLLDGKFERGEDCILLEQMRAADKRGELREMVKAVAR